MNINLQLQRFIPIRPTEIPADRAARIDALAPDRSRVSLLLPEMSRSMQDGERRIERQKVPTCSRADALRQLLAKNAEEMGSR